MGTAIWALPGSTLAESPAEVVTVPVRIELVPGAPEALASPIAVRLTAQRLDGPGGQPALLEPAGAGPWTLDLPRSSRWAIRAQAPGAWIRGLDLEVGAVPPEPVKLTVWRLGTIRGTVAIEGRSRERPKALVLTTLKPRPSLGSRAVPKFQLECPLDERGHWTCDIPAATYDLGFSAAGFSPIYRWNLPVSAKVPLDLGLLTFRSGGSIAGWIEVPGGAVDPKTCQARLVPSISPVGSSVETVEKTGQKERAAPCRPEGLFQLAGLEPGLYDLSVSQAGLTPFRQAGVAVYRDAESFLREAAVLRPPLRLKLTVLPPLDPYGKPWRVRGYRREEGGTVTGEAFSGQADDLGQWERPNVQAGLYRLEAESSQGERMAALFDVPIDGDADAFAEIRVDWIDLQGRLLVGGRESAGTLWFGGRQGLVSVRFQADEEGRFAGFLPLRVGRRWWVDIETERQTSRRWIEVAPNSKNEARVEVDLPDNRVFGRVLDAAGRPVSGSRVTVESLRPGQPPELPEVVETEEHGSFEARSLAPGRVSVQAEAGSPSSFSGVAEIDLDREGEVGPVELRLQEARTLKGKVRGPFGAVPGARLLAFPYPEARSVDAGRTDFEGRFQVRVPQESLGTLAVVSPAGLALTAFLVPADRAEAELEVRGAGGTLELVLPGPARRDPPLLTGYLEQNGLPLPMVAVRPWAAERAAQPQPTDDRVTVVAPNLAPGTYRLCLSEAGELAPPPPAARCVSGTLAEGGVTRLDLASPPER